MIKYIYILDQNTFSPFCICILAIAKIYIQKRSKNNQQSCFFANSKLQHHKNTKCKEQNCKEQKCKEQKCKEQNCREQKYKRKKYIMRETSTGPQQKSRACSLQGPLAASPAEIWTRIRWPRLDFLRATKYINVIDETMFFSEVDEVVHCLQSKAPEEMLLWALVRLWRWRWTV